MRKKSHFLSKVLRHQPQAANLTLDEHGWANVDELLHNTGMTMEELETIVATNNKQRFSFNDDHTLIRANQGHSIPVDVELEAKEPPEFLYHGTAVQSVPSIDQEGLKPMSRLYVHLSKDKETALMTGKRHGRPIVYVVRSGEMARDGYTFYQSVNGVWLIKHVPPAYLSKK
ncbi:MAG: RNA 2'-phosphotransferase [Erysipelotrichaceae bacterium]|nr:RNA 2'-phosphotransferase [Erysipelotrichaceae bacterium]